MNKYIITLRLAVLSFGCLWLLTSNTQAATFVVDNTGNTALPAIYTFGDGTNTLRKCINLANANPGPDIIEFNIPVGPFVIADDLPAITTQIFINGLSQPTASSTNLLIEINGTGLNGLQVNGAGASGTLIQGFVIYGTNRGIYLDATTNVTIRVNHIGTNAAGTGPAPAIIDWNGIEINNTTNTIIGGATGLDRNIISGANQQGIRIQNNSTGTQILGNYIGGNLQNGIFILSASNNSIIGGITALHRNYIGANGQQGIRIENASGTQIIGNYIGTDITGSIAVQNLQNGIYLFNGTNTIIGGPTVNHRNIISGNRERGIMIERSNNAMIQNNFIGTTSSGNAALGNGQQGILITNVSHFPQILDNVVSSSINSGGIGIYGDASTFSTLIKNPTIKGNKIGLGLNGTTALPNFQSGLVIENSRKPTIGGVLLTDRNYVSSNSEVGIRIYNGDSAIVKNNYIGTDITGTIDMGNGQTGLAINYSDTTTIGGSLASEGNLISGNNQTGLMLEWSVKVLIQNNLIGTTVSGNAALGNGQRGILAANFCTNLSILDNSICSNGESGVGIFNDCHRPIIKGNRIGLGKDGTTPLGNSQHGIQLVNSRKPILGGALLAERNYISNNTFMGALIENGDSLIAKGNYIGVNGTGMADHGNGQTGLFIILSDTITIGGANAGEGNLVSGNNEHGIYITGGPSFKATIQGNIIGLGSDKILALGNGQVGLRVGDCARSIIGGEILGERNFVSSNQGTGIEIFNSPFSIIKGNYIGVDVTGNLNRGNRGPGVRVDNSREVLVGGANAKARNIVAASITGDGIVIVGTSQKTSVKANFVGIGADGVTDLGNWGSGINLFGEDADSCFIGGSTFMERNVTSNNGKSTVGDGIRIEGPDATTILGNFCGVDSTGTIVKGNSWAGLSLNESDDNIVGGSGPFEGNILSGNLNEGVWLRGASRNKFFGNSIGTDRSGTLQLGNQDWGLAISEAAAPNFDNLVGGSLANANKIAYNLNLSGPGSGVNISSPSQRNTITFNSIYCNAGQGINLEGTANESVPTPVITTRTTTSVSGTGVTGNIIHAYVNLTTDGGVKCDCEGEVYLGTTTVAGGTWTVAFPAITTSPDAITVTQTTPAGSTSEFTNCPVVLPVSYAYFNAIKTESEALLNWGTASEKNNKEFLVQRSENGINFSTIGVVPGNNNSSELINYSFVDPTPSSEIVYYRIIQIDYSGRNTSSPVRQVTFATESINIRSTPEKEILIQSSLKGDSELMISVFSANGQLVYHEEYPTLEGMFEKRISLSQLASGIYLVKVYNADQYAVKKVEIK